MCSAWRLRPTMTNWSCQCSPSSRSTTGVARLAIAAAFATFVNDIRRGTYQLESGGRIRAGEAFGPGGAVHVRLNFGTSSEILEQAVTRMASALRAV